MATWREDTIRALKNLNGVAHLSEIHKEVEKLRKGKLNNTWTQTVQRELETYSSDSEAYGGGKDIFYMAEGKGKGVWGLRNLNEGERIFGEIKGTHVGQIFKDRKELAAAGIHAPPMGGIWGSGEEGASSIVLSGGYEDDIDDWNNILYTGQGGQDKPGGKQIANQEFILGNEGLRISCKYNLPVRVTRGYQIKNGPSKGYRYDGVYYVNNFERVKGKSGLYVCRFYLSTEKTVEKFEAELKHTLKNDYKKTERKKSTINTIQRNPKWPEYVKKLYENKCQICNIYLRTHDGAVSIGAHIKGLGKDHKGPDQVNNIICLCPNHHSQFDGFGFYIDEETFEIKGLEGYEGKKLTIKEGHNIDSNFFKYHYEQYKKHN
jgi:putative restriction endonuclease